MNSRHFIQGVLLGVLTLLPVHRIMAEGDSFLATLLRFTGITATPSTVKGNDNFMTGDIWLAQVSAAKASAPQKITTDGSYHSPLWIPGGQSILAMKGDKLVQLNVQGKEEKIRYTLTNNTVLLGFDKQDERRILVLQRPLAVGIFTLANGQITPLPYNDNNPEEREAFAQLRKDFRRYDSVNVSVNDKKQPSSKGYRSVYTILIELLNGEDISINCPSACSQPALAADGRQLLFIGE